MSRKLLGLQYVMISAACYIYIHAICQIAKLSVVIPVESKEWYVVFHTNMSLIFFTHEWSSVMFTFEEKMKLISSLLHDSLSFL